MAILHFEQKVFTAFFNTSKFYIGTQQKFLNTSHILTYSNSTTRETNRKFDNTSRTELTTSPMADFVCKNIRDMVYARNEIVCENRVIEHEINILKAEIAPLQVDIQELESELYLLKEEMRHHGQNKKVNVDEIRKKEAMYKKFQAELRHLSEKNDSLLNCYHALEKEINKYEDKIVSYEKCLNDLVRTCQEMNNAAEELSNRNRETEASIQSLKTNLAKLKACLNKKSAELEEKCNELDEAFQRYKKIECVRETLERPAKNLRKQIMEVDAQSNQWKRCVEKEQMRCEALHDKLVCYKDLSNALQRKAQNFEKEMTKIRQRKHDHIKEIINSINKQNDTECPSPNNELAKPMRRSGSRNEIKNQRKTNTQKSMGRDECRECRQMMVDKIRELLCEDSPSTYEMFQEREIRPTSNKSHRH